MWAPVARVHLWQGCKYYELLPATENAFPEKGIAHVASW